jgi:hypothetical protein
LRIVAGQGLRQASAEKGLERAKVVERIGHVPEIINRRWSIANVLDLLSF